MLSKGSDHRHRGIGLETPVNTLDFYAPGLENREYKKLRKTLYDERKLRIMMRGVKIGRKKGGGRVSLMNVFEIGKDKAGKRILDIE